jgi:putative oxidoreductase
MRRLPSAVAWSISIILALLFVAVGYSKIWGTSAAVWNSRFVNWGYPAGSQHVIGAVEIVSGLALLLPRSRKPAAASLVLVMAGALCTHLIHSELVRIISPLILGALALLLFFSPPATEYQRATS